MMIVMPLVDLKNRFQLYACTGSIITHSSISLKK